MDSSTPLALCCSLGMTSSCYNVPVPKPRLTVCLCVIFMNVLGIMALQVMVFESERLNLGKSRDAFW